MKGARLFSPAHVPISLAMTGGGQLSVKRDFVAGLGTLDRGQTNQTQQKPVGESFTYFLPHGPAGQSPIS
jgi:hypothetical protein